MIASRHVTTQVGSIEPAPLIDEDLFERADAAARAIRAAFDAWRMGRGMPVDRAVLQESDAVSDTFIDEVTKLAKRLD